MTFKEWVIDLFKDERGAISVKPVIAFVGALFLCGTMLANSFSHKEFAPAPELVTLILPTTLMAPAFNVPLVTLSELNLLVAASKVKPAIIALLSTPLAMVPVNLRLAVEAVAVNA